MRFTFNSPILRFPKPKMPALQTFPNIAGDTVAITFVGYAVSVSLAMIYADKHGYSIDPNQVNLWNDATAWRNVRFLHVNNLTTGAVCLVSGTAGSRYLQHRVLLFHLLPELSHSRHH